MIRTVGLMTPVEITQYFGRQEERVVRILVPARYRQAYEELRAMGCRLTARFQPAGKVKMTIEHEEGDFAVVVTDAEPTKVQQGMDDLLGAWNDKHFDKWVAILSWGIWEGAVWWERGLYSNARA